MDAYTKARDNAVAVRRIYSRGFAFPEWTLQGDEWAAADFKSTVVLYHADASLADVQLLATQREPCNIAMGRHYDADAMEKHFELRYQACYGAPRA